MKKENSTNSINDKYLENFCNSYKVLSLITGRWKVSIIFTLKETTKSYSDLKLEFPNLTDRILTKQLKELQIDHLIENEKDKTKSIYKLSSKGDKVLSLLENINKLDL
ncbi:MULTISPECIES: helix-turn-helix domain-containing protein [unclassified Empedobacter]|uniref:winged helix-turn-helix transcriptional regulator n=1 Tax=unclassified Empedobacter TaxID=2643773 RepID=UPI0025BDBEC2|nr:MULTISPECIES: helix-turn-helix domain-containing protein [unclassified Empedobacter]